MHFRAPAKINLSLKILHRRPDGYHEIETLMTPISLSDRLAFQTADMSRGIQFRCDDPSLPAGEDNLVVRAARAFLLAAKKSSGVTIVLEKTIPHGAGLGGGSSDAAATLLGLNKLFDAKLGPDALRAIAARLGSDIPFFIFESPAICRGRGETVTPAVLPRKFPLLLLKPNFGVPTPWAYAHWSAARELPGISYAPQEFAGTVFVNDLERPVFEKYLFLARLKMWLLEQAEVAVALLSGSGSTVFALLRDPVEADALAKRARAVLDPELWTCACETL